MESETDVIVIGGGPIGLTTFLALRRQGVDAVLVERHPGTAVIPKALMLNERSMEIYRSLGIYDDIARVSLPRDEVGYLYSGDTLRSDTFDRFPMVYVSEHTGVLSQLCSQDALEPVLRAHADRLSPGSVLFGTSLEGICQDATGVEVEIRDLTSRERRTLRSRYAVAADGSRSTVRSLLDIGMRGAETLQHSIHAIFQADLNPLLADRVSAMYYVGGDTASVGGLPGLLFVIVDGARRWRLMFDYDPQQADQARDESYLRGLIRLAVGAPDLDIEFEGVYPWEPAALLADTFRAGRVFLAGDAAHIRPPWGGLGMNAGIGDAHNLSWKLAEVVAGRAGDALLDTYELERRPIAQRTIDAAMRNAGQNIQVRSPDAAMRLANNRRRRAEGLILGYSYASPSVIPDGTAAPVVEDEQVDYVPTARPGHRAPHFWVVDGDARKSVGDLFGSGYVLLTGADGKAWPKAVAGLADRFPAQVRTYVVGGPAADVDDPDHRWEQLYGCSSDGAVLVRPDGHVAWRSPETPGDPTAVLAGVLADVTAWPGD